MMNVIEAQESSLFNSHFFLQWKNICVDRKFLEKKLTNICIETLKMKKTLKSYEQLTSLSNFKLDLET